MKKLLVVIAAAALCLAIAGCAGNGTLSDEILDDTGAFKITADDAGEGSAIGSLGGGITVEEGQIVVISPNLDEGTLGVRLLDDGGEVVVDEAIDGKVFSVYQLEPGEYSLGVSCEKNGTTGTMIIAAVDEQEFQQQGEDLEAVLGIESSDSVDAEPVEEAAAAE